MSWDKGLVVCQGIYGTLCGWRYGGQNNHSCNPSNNIHNRKGESNCPSTIHNHKEDRAIITTTLTLMIAFINIKGTTTVTVLILLVQCTTTRRIEQTPRPSLLSTIHKPCVVFQFILYLHHIIILQHSLRHAELSTHLSGS